MQIKIVRAFVVCALVASGLVAAPRPATAAVDNPVLSIPPAGLRSQALWDSWFDLNALGYEEAEYFVSGTAKDAASATAPYTTRIVVTRPSDPERFNGTVLIDWVNVTAQFENAVDIVEAHEYLLREGYAYVHVSAQSAGICCTPLTPKIWDPVRYQALSHPGDTFAFDMFSQVAQAIGSPQGIDPLDGLPSPRRIIASGQSQSASRLDTYVRNWQAQAGVIDGFLIHGGGGKTYPAPPAAPVLHLLSDAEASTTEPNQTENYRLWEIAGTSHSDFWIGYHQIVGQGPRFAGGPKQPASADEDLHAVAGNYGEQPHPMHATCIAAGGSFPMRYSVSAALDHLDRWVRTGTAPPAGPRFTFDDAGALARDEHNNALGGIRLPPIDVPVASYISDSCALGGVTVPFTEAQLLLLYPTHADYFTPMTEKTKAAVDAGFLLPEDAADLLERACAAKNRWADLSGSPCEIDVEPHTVAFDAPGTVHTSKPKKNGVPVAFYSTQGFDATAIDPGSVCVFEDGTEPEPAPPCGLLRSETKDVNADGLADLELRFDTSATPMTAGEHRTICGAGRTTKGVEVRGCDPDVRVA